MKNLINNNTITLKGTWECFTEFVKIIWKVIYFFIESLYRISLWVYFLFGFVLMQSKEGVPNNYLFYGLLIVVIYCSPKKEKD